MALRLAAGWLGLALACAWTVPAWSADAPAKAPPTPARPRPILPLEPTFTNPDWSRRPTAEDVERFYPPLALKLKLSGVATISCPVNKAGDLHGCVVLSEVPAGFGFGAAAVALAGLFRMTPQRLDGEPTDGGVVKIPINFTVVSTDYRLGPGPGAAASAPSAAALALGRRLASAVSGEDGAHLAVEADLAALRSDALAAPSPARALVLEDLASAEAALAPGRLETLARRYALSLKPAELAAIVSFMESPAGRAWNAATTAYAAAAAAVAPSLAEPVIVDARARLCRQITCAGDQGPAPGGAARP